MPDTILLRFRDVTGNDTISLHRACISKAGYTWWGWWRKESEPSRLAELAEISERAKKGQTTVGLFDRSTDRFFAATLLDCVYEPNGDLASPDPRFTPSYYAGKKLPAWFKFTSIEYLDREQFHATFREIPLGDWTLFPVWYDTQPDQAGEALARKEQLDAFHSDILVLKANTILHLSDLHFGADYGYPKTTRRGKSALLDILKRDVSDNADDGLGLLVVSGDLTTQAEPDPLLDDAVEFLRKLTAIFKLPPERVIIVPGNHDFKLVQYEPEDYKHERWYRRFLKDFYGVEQEIIQIKQFKLPSGQPLEILLINSVRLRRPEESNFGYIQWQLYEDLLSLGERDPRALRMAVLHHHLVAAPREEEIDPGYPQAGISITLDSGTAIEGLQRHGFQLALHGHQHVPAITKVARGRLGARDNTMEGLTSDLYVVAAGSSGSKRLGDAMPFNTYNLLRLCEEAVQVTTRSYTAGWGPGLHYQAQMSLTGQVKP